MRIRTILSTLLLAVFTLTLVACNELTPNPIDEGKAVPVYQGMVVSETLSTISSNVNEYLDIMKLSSEEITHYSNMNSINPDDPFGTVDSGTISDIIEAEYPITQVEITDYYSEINKDIFITVKLSNPDNHVILSFTLNSVFYQSYQFQEGSDSENLILKVNTGNESGVKDYTIDAIKYIEGSDIKDVIFAGEKTISVGLKYSSEPHAIITNEVVNATSISLTANLTDTSSISTLNKIVLYDGESLISTYDLVIGVNNIVFDNLNVNTLYQYAVISIYDLMDGNNMKLSILNKKALYTDNIIAFDTVIPTQSSIAFGITISDLNQTGTITAIELYKGDTLVETLVDTNIREFTDLLSNHEYIIKVIYTFDLNDGVGPQIISIAQSIRTIPKAAPEVSFINVVPTNTTIEFEAEVLDLDQVIDNITIQLYQDNSLVQEYNDLNNLVFYGLTPNTEYNIKLIYRYNLNEGNQLNEESVDNIVMTTLFTGGDGSLEKPFQIYNQDDLINMTKQADKYYILMNDIDLLNIEWTPIGTIDAPFNGFFNGNFHSIFNLTITAPELATGWNYIGLFGSATGIIENLSLVDVSINVEGNLNQSVMTGGVVAHVTYDGLLLREIYVDGAISNTVRVNSFSWVGGFVGLSNGLLSIERSESNTSVTNDLGRSIQGGRKSGTDTYGSGGFVGCANNNIHISDSINYGEINSTSDAAGFVATLYGMAQINNVTNYGIINGINSAAGIIGYSTQDIDLVSSVNVGMISSVNFAAGLIAYAGDNSFSNIQVSNNSASVNSDFVSAGLIGVSGKLVIANSWNTGDITGINYVGGIAGITEIYYVNMQSVYNHGDIYVIESSSYVSSGGIIGLGYSVNITFVNVSNTGNIFGFNHAGGFIGIVLGENKIINIRNSYNSGDVSSTHYAGGFIGFDEGMCSILIDKSYNSGIITSSMYSAAFVGKAYIISITNSISYNNILVYQYIDGDFSNNYALSSNEQSQIFDIEIINSSLFYISTLHWDENIWDFSNMDISNGLFPILKNE